VATEWEAVRREEDAWQAMTRDAGPRGLYWALVKLLIRRGVFTAEELRDEIASETRIRDIQ
jgi:hypothetical protein